MTAWGAPDGRPYISGMTIICSTGGSRRTALGLVLLAGIVGGAGACHSQSPPWVTLPTVADSVGPAIHIVGIIEHAEVEGGVYTIRAADGTNYNPTNLPQQFARAGLNVEADGRELHGMAGIHQVGPLVELQRIRER
jgi:hypothetical protein